MQISVVSLHTKHDSKRFFIFGKFRSHVRTCTVRHIRGDLGLIMDVCVRQSIAMWMRTARADEFCARLLTYLGSVGISGRNWWSRAYGNDLSTYKSPVMSWDRNNRPQ